MTAENNKLRTILNDELHVFSVTEKSPADPLQQVLDSIEQTNDSIRAATQAGISIELIRTSRLHNGQGSWGDQIAPAIRLTDG